MTAKVQHSTMDNKSLNDSQIIDLVMKITKTADVDEMLQVLNGWADLEVHVLTLKNEMEKAISILKDVEQKKLNQ